MANPIGHFEGTTEIQNYPQVSEICYNSSHSFIKILVKIQI